MPTFTHGKNTKVFVNGYDLSVYFNQATTAKTADTAEVSTFQNAAKTYLPGMTDATMSLEGFLDKTTGASGPVLDAALGVEFSVLAHLPEGDATGKTGKAMQAVETAFSPSSNITEANKITASFQSDTAADAVTSLAPIASRTGGGTVNGVDFGTAQPGTGAAVGYVQVTALNGGTAVIKIQDSADNVTFADLITFSNVTAAGTAQRLAASGTARRYVRTVHTVTGGTASYWTGISPTTLA